MTILHTVSLTLDDHAYDIHVGTGLLPDIAALVPLALTGRTLFVLTDENVRAPHAETVRAALEATGAAAVHVLALPAGEATKSMARLEEVLSWMLERHVDRKSVLFAVGGGVIGDLGGFAAATVMRGIPFVQVPTTLLAQVDSSVGGKTGINTKQGKNLVGAFYQPISVVCDLDTLATLPQRELLAGYAEVLKYGLIDDEPFFTWLEEHGAAVSAREPEALAYAVATSCRKKADIVGQDEKEQGLRALLNLGHTFGHALEGVAGYDGRLLHGEGVAIGIVMALTLSAQKGLCPRADLDRARNHLEALSLPVRAAQIEALRQSTVDDILDYMTRDKKAEKGQMVFILARGIGQSFIARDVPLSEAAAVIESSLAS